MIDLNGMWMDLLQENLARLVVVEFFVTIMINTYVSFPVWLVFLTEMRPNFYSSKRLCLLSKKSLVFGEIVWELFQNLILKMLFPGLLLLETIHRSLRICIVLLLIMLICFSCCVLSIFFMKPIGLLTLSQNKECIEMNVYVGYPSCFGHGFLCFAVRCSLLLFVFGTYP